MIKFPALLLCLLVICNATAQVLKPGFDAEEYKGTLRRSALQVDTKFRGTTPKETEYTRIYRSREVGLHNKWDLWLNTGKTIAIVQLRGTINEVDSWLENFYSAMIPATGSLKLDSNVTFNYKLAADPKATVHVGWMIGIGVLGPDVIRKLKDLYTQGVKQVIVEGHSQGGALSILMTSYLHYKQQEGALPRDIIFKTYASAAPKPGNLYYAYDYDYITRGGWAFTVVNTADWVPETPVSIQTPADFNKLNPFTNSQDQIRGQKWVVRAALKHVYHRLSKTPHRAQRTYEHYVGRMAYKQVRKYMPYFEQPAYSGTSNYMRAGSPIALQPDADYYQHFPDSGNNVFRHHIFEPYYFLMQKNYPSADAVSDNKP